MPRFPIRYPTGPTVATALSDARHLLALPYPFVRQQLLTPDGFRNHAKALGIAVSESTIEDLHRTRILEPLFEVRRDARRLAQVARNRPDDPWALAELKSTDTSVSFLRRTHAAGRLFDPHLRPFVSRNRDLRPCGDYTYSVRQYLYSPLQATFLADGIDELTLQRRYGATVGAGRRERVAVERNALLACIALEAIAPQRFMEFHGEGDEGAFVRYLTWHEGSEPRSVPGLIGFDPAAARVVANRWEDYLATWDPLEDWLDLVAEIPLNRLRKLRGSARLAIERRIMIESLFAGIAVLEPSAEPPREHLPPLRPRAPKRLLRSGSLDPVLSRYGLSPHPSLVLVVEGETEVRLVPRAMEHLGIPLRRDFIRLVNRHGVDQSLVPLLDHVAAIDFTEPESDGWIATLHPITRVLVVTDAEGSMMPKVVNGVVERWKTNLLAALPNDVAREAVGEHLLADAFRVRYWNSTHDAFEFAHFTDYELADAVLAAESGPPRQTRESLTKSLAQVRSRRGPDNRQGSLEKAILRQRNIDKTRLHEHLIPGLEKRIAEADLWTSKIPLVAVLAEAVRLANELPREQLGFRPPS